MPLCYDATQNHHFKIMDVVFDYCVGLLSRVSPGALVGPTQAPMTGVVRRAENACTHAEVHKGMAALQWTHERVQLAVSSSTWLSGLTLCGVRTFI